MTRILRALVAAVCLLAMAGTADAANRVLLTPPSNQSHAGLKAVAMRDGRVKVIVGLRVPFAPEGAMAPGLASGQRMEIAKAAAVLKTRFLTAAQRNPDAFRAFSTVPALALEVTPGELDQLISDPMVLSLSENRLRKPLLAESVPLVGADQAWSAGYSGTGQVVAILDTGVDKTHPFLSGKVVSEACYSLGRWCPGKTTQSTAVGSGMPCPGDCDHGTHVAGIAAGKGSSFSGVAKDAKIMAVQVFSNAGGGEPGAYDSDILAGLERVYDLRASLSIAAVNMSLGGGQYFSTCDGEVPSVTAVIENLRSAGIATVAASGNDSFTDSISWPACISSAVSVGAVSDSAFGLCDGSPSAVDKVACYSNSASFVSLLAPGSVITSSVPNNGYASWHGTSMATPHVAGAFAILRERASGATVSALLTALQDTGTPITDYRNSIVTKRINVKAALDTLPAVSRLVYTKAGSGAGQVVSSPAGIDCTASCAATFADGTEVTLAATPAAGSQFVGWSGDCSGTGDCHLSLTGVHNVTATFATLATYQLIYAKKGRGAGTVTSAPAGLNCAGRCTVNFARDSTVTLTATPAAGSVFAGWDGVCSGTGSCVVVMARDRKVNAKFLPN